ncbi:alpha/beta hydrolase [Sphingopyxis sp.]|jgi:acetyl esterase/lipase|uniref:alpha/beta hydrolase n=1 Tax=Sphingopyxis sp. TaxID=1908224 RepID=UPI002DEC2D4B|nr:alpha/beta hydrolase [Sphingopyxis sp.]
MKDAATPARPIAKWSRRIALLVIGAIVLLCFALTLGAFVPALPFLGVFGSLALSIWPAAIASVAIVGALVMARLASGRARSIFVFAAGLAALGATVATVRLLSMAARNDIRLSAGAPFGSGGLLGPAAPPDQTLTYLRDLGEDLTLHIWRPAGAPPPGGWPVLAYVHGGGWTSGDALGRGTDMRWFARQGWLTVGIEYSLSGPKRHLSDRVHGQLGCALAWTANHIAERGGDPGRIGLFGESAGGNLVLNLASMANAGTLPSACGGSVPRIGAVSAVYPAADIAAVWANDYMPTGAGVRVMAEQYTGGSPASFPARYAATASAAHLGRATPPTLLFITENDHLVPPASMHAYDAAARRAGVEVKTISIPYGEHGFDAAGIGHATVRQATINFFRSHIAR